MSMKKFIGIVGLTVLISGCQSVNDFIGTGPVTLSPAVSKHYESTYLKEAGPQYYVVSADGTNATYTYCSVGTGICQFGVVVLDAISSCEKRSGQKCYIFAEGDEVVWKGPVSYSGSSSRTTSHIKIASVVNGYHLCNSALGAAGGLSWTTESAYQNFVNKAEEAGLTENDCAQIVAAGNPSIPENLDRLKTLSTELLCKVALDVDGWRRDPDDWSYVDEARLRDLTRAKCEAILN